MIFEFFNRHKLGYQRFDHPAVYTCEEARRVVPNIPGTDLKNLFLRDAKGRQHFLLAVSPDKKVDLKVLSTSLNVPKLGFASAERLKKYLDLEPGSVTLLGVINDINHQVQVLIDREIWEYEYFQCHPLMNTSTVVISKESLIRFFELTGHIVEIIEVPAKEDDNNCTD